MNPSQPYDTLRDICRNRHSIRHFTGQPVTPDQIAAIVDIAKTSPYASNKKNWQVVTVADRETIRAMAEAVDAASKAMVTKARDDFREDFAQYTGFFSGFRSAPCLLIPVFRVSRAVSYMVGEQAVELEQWERDNYVKSIACVSMLILLAAQSLGLGACFMTGPLLAEDRLRQLAGIKTGRRIGAVIPVGYYKEETHGD